MSPRPKRLRRSQLAVPGVSEKMLTKPQRWRSIMYFATSRTQLHLRLKQAREIPLWMRLMAWIGEERSVVCVSTMWVQSGV